MGDKIQRSTDSVVKKRKKRPSVPSKSVPKKKLCTLKAQKRYIQRIQKKTLDSRKAQFWRKYPFLMEIVRLNNGY